MDSNDQADDVWLLGIQRKLYQWSDADSFFSRRCACSALDVGGCRRLATPLFLESRVHNERCTPGSVSGRWKPAAAMSPGANARLYSAASHSS